MRCGLARGGAADGRVREGSRVYGCGLCAGAGGFFVGGGEGGVPAWPRSRRALARRIWLDVAEWFCAMRHCPAWTASGTVRAFAAVLDRIDGSGVRVVLAEDGRRF